MTFDVVDLEAPGSSPSTLRCRLASRTASRFRSHSSTPARVGQRLFERSASPQVGGATSWKWPLAGGSWPGPPTHSVAWNGSQNSVQSHRLIEGRSARWSTGR